MSKELTIQNQGGGFSVSIPTEAQEQKTKTLALAEKITAVSDLNTQQNAIEVVSYLNGLAKGMEKTREEVKKPFLEAGRLIDSTAKAYTKEIDSESKRIQGLIGGFQDQDRKKAELARLEQERIQREAQESLRKAHEAASTAQTESERQSAQLDAMELEEEATAPIVIHEAPKAEGASVGEAWNFDTVNVHELYRAFPHLCKVEVNRSAILYHLKTLALENKPVTLPGLRTFKETKVSIRSAKL